MFLNPEKGKIILIHGNGGSTSQDAWLPWVQQELERLGLQVINETFPDNEIAHQSIWLSHLEILGADDQTILVGHSSGAVAAMRFAQTHNIFGSILVGACYTDLGYESERESGYYDVPWDWNSIKRNQNWILQFASTDDPFIPIQEARFIHEQLNTEYSEFTNRGHFSEGEKAQAFPELIDGIKRKLEM